MLISLYRLSSLILSCLCRFSWRCLWMRSACRSGSSHFFVFSRRLTISFLRVAIFVFLQRRTPSSAHRARPLASQHADTHTRDSPEHVGVVEPDLTRIHTSGLAEVAATTCPHVSNLADASTASSPCDNKADRTLGKSTRPRQILRLTTQHDATSLLKSPPMHARAQEASSARSAQARQALRIIRARRPKASPRGCEYHSDIVLLVSLDRVCLDCPHKRLWHMRVCCQTPPRVSEHHIHPWWRTNNKCSRHGMKQIMSKEAKC